MYERYSTLEEIQKAASQQTRELREMAQALSFWLDGVHYPSEGGYLEYAVRSYLRRRIPKRFEVSTGFISTLEADTKPDAVKGRAIRKVSRQFDIIIWDADSFPPLFKADDFVVVIPESVRAVLEITKRLTPRKAIKDLQKFDDLREFYSYERQQFRPYTAMLAFSGSQKIAKLLQTLEQFYLVTSHVPVLYRYRFARDQGLESRPYALPCFIDSICVLDQGLIKGKIENTLLGSSKSVVRYSAYENETDNETAFGFFERDIVLNLSQSTASGYFASVDIYREFMYAASQKPSGSLIIEDCETIFPSLNVRDKANSITNHPTDIVNVSQFVGADFTSDHPNPTMYIEEAGSKTSIIERHPDNIFASGYYDLGIRKKLWRLFQISEESGKYRICFYRKMENENFQEILESLKATPWEEDVISS